MSVIFTPGITVTPIVGSVSYGDGNMVTGGGQLPNNMAAKARNGSCQVIVDSANVQTLTALIALVSAVGEGACDITGTDIIAAQQSFDALVEVSFEGEAVQVANITWKGTIAPAA